MLEAATDRVSAVRYAGRLRVTAQWQELPDNGSLSMCDHVGIRSTVVPYALAVYGVSLSRQAVCCISHQRNGICDCVCVLRGEFFFRPSCRDGHNSIKH